MSALRSSLANTVPPSTDAVDRFNLIPEVIGLVCKQLPSGDLRTARRVSKSYYPVATGELFQRGGLNLKDFDFTDFGGKGLRAAQLPGYDPKLDYTRRVSHLPPRIEKVS
jgi:hypothetical protein